MNTTITGICIVLAIALIGSTILTGLVRRLEIIDDPNERSSHSRPTPRGGGIGLVIMTLIGLIGSQIIWQLTSWRGLMFYLGAATLVAVVSWLDDLKSLSARSRFLVHFLAAGLVIAGWGHWEEVNLPLLGSIYIGQGGLLLALLWIVGLTNAYNFMDGIDGIAGGQALVAGIGWATVGWMIEDKFVFATGGLLAASSMGFLFYNWSPAKIFMGDVGSAFLGFTFAAVPVMATPSAPINRASMFLIGILLLWPFILDTGFTLLRRLTKGENIFQAHRSHFYQRMVIAGYSHQIVTLLYIGLAVIGSVLSLLLTKRN
jgi:UDP-N-acetylmuramyl pentapeptide phosphotransferase/UDP-N-acetylglucosamine-1-phosphate transferase